MKQTMAEKELDIVKSWFEELSEQLRFSTKKVLELEFEKVSKVRTQTVFSTLQEGSDEDAQLPVSQLTITKLTK